MTEAERVLLSCFTSSKGTLPREAAFTYLRHIQQEPTPKAVGAALAMVKQLVEGGILVLETKSISPYTEDMISSYSRARRIPPEVCTHVIRTGSVLQETSVLDIATGTGEIARQLAHASSHVTGIDSSKNFLSVARFQAQSQPHPPEFVQACANRLVLHDATYDLVTLCQAFHWLNPALTVRGIQHVLKPNGLLFLIESKSMLPISHPLRTALKYGDSDEAFVERECVRQANWYSRLFDLLRRPNGLLRLAEVSVFRERRVFDFEFARAFFFEEQVRAALGTDGHPWDKLANLLSGRSSNELAESSLLACDVLQPRCSPGLSRARGVALRSSIHPSG